MTSPSKLDHDLFFLGILICPFQIHDFPETQARQHMTSVTTRVFPLEALGDENEQQCARPAQVGAARQELRRLGKRASIPLRVNFMKLRARSCDHSTGGADRGGKSKMDVWQQKSVSHATLVHKDGKDTLGDFFQ